jgi:RNA polymerase-binding transcription factor DksA
MQRRTAVNATALSARDLRHYRRELEALAGRLSGTTARLAAEATRPTGSEGTAAEAPTHEPTPTATEGEEEVAVTALRTEGQLLAEARAALARLDKGTYGRCERCGRTITRTRLDAVPYARHCIGCAEPHTLNASET